MARKLIAIICDLGLIFALGASIWVIAALTVSTKSRAEGFHCWDLTGCPTTRHRRKHRPKVVVERRFVPMRGYLDEPKHHCLPERIRGLGTQWIGTQGALDAAKKDWMERVRYDHGESYLDLSHAEDFEKRCGRVSIGEVAGQVTYRCEILARPCKAEFEKQEGQ